MFLVICYYSPDARRRAQIAKILLDYGQAIQTGVFEIQIAANDAEELLSRLGDVLDKEKDSLRVYRLCRTCLAGTRLYGKAEITGQETVFVV